MTREQDRREFLKRGVAAVDSVAQVEENVRFAREFNPLSRAQVASLEDKAKPVFEQALFFRRWT